MCTSLGFITLPTTPGNSSSEREQGMKPNQLEQIILTCVLLMAEVYAFILSLMHFTYSIIL